MLHLEKYQLDELEKFLEHVNQNVGFLGTFICSDEGLIVLSTKNNDRISHGVLDIDAIAALIASFLFQNDIMDISFISDLSITFNRIIIHVHLIRNVKSGKNKLILINLIPIEIRYYKRIIKKINSKIADLLN